MEQLVETARKKMLLSPSVCSIKAAEAGLKGSTLVMLPAVFCLVAVLLRAKCMFAILFRSFGSDHMRIKEEWNAFCEMRHPVFSHLLRGCGPLDGSIPGVPDRRIHRSHTLYRDSAGPLLILDRLTNGPEDKVWDSWAKQKPPATEDTRGGRRYAHDELKARTVDGFEEIQAWMKNTLMEQATSTIKDDWAWWTWNSESSSAGKLVTLIPGEEETRQIFFDDNIEHGDTKIVDCRGVNGKELSKGETPRICVTVNPVEALLDDSYFAKKLVACYSDHLSEEDYMEFSMESMMYVSQQKPTPALIVQSD
jgi:hypothetical protein